MRYSRPAAARLLALAAAAAIVMTAGAFAQTSAAEQAVLKADAAALEKLLGDELSYTHSNASVQNKAAFISDIKTGKIKYLSVEPTDQKARVFGTTAVVTGGASVHVIQNGNDLTFKIRYTDTHVNRNGSWQMVAWQSTRLPS
jgi:hypothetical protein